MLMTLIHSTAQALTVRVDDASGVSGAKGITVSITVADGVGLAGGDLTLTYTTSALTAQRVTAGSLASSAGITVIGNIATAGQVKISMAGATGLLSGNGVLAAITFDVHANAAPGTYKLELTRTVFRNEQAQIIPVQSVSSGSFTVTGNGTQPPVSGAGIVVRVDTVSAKPGDADVSVGIRIENGVGLAGGDLTLTYDASVLTAKRVTPGSLATASSINVIGNTTTIGQVKISMAGATGISSDSGVLVNVFFDVKQAVPAGRYTLEVTRVVLRNEQAQVLQVQNIFSGSLTITTSPGGGDQPPGSESGITIRVEDGSASPGDTAIAIDILVEDAAGLAGGDLTLTYDASVLTAKRVTPGPLISSSGITVIGNIATTGQVKISMAGATGISSDNGVLVTLTFDVKSTAQPGVFNLTLTKVVLRDETAAVLTIAKMSNGKVSIQEETLPNFSISLDLNTASGDQALQSLTGIQPASVISIQIFGKNIKDAIGFSTRFEYDPAQLAYEEFEIGSALPNAQSPGPIQGTNPAWVEVGAAVFGGTVTSDDGWLGTIRFRTDLCFSGTVVRMVRAEIHRAGQFETLNTEIVVDLKASPSSDFNENGTVDFSDFLLFASAFKQTNADPKFDLNGDGEVGFQDFFIFAGNFGKKACRPG
jgi:hypothetical protein